MLIPDRALPDSALPDGALPDGDLPDGDLPDSALPDSALPDSALPDMAPPVVYLLEECAPTWGSWISDARSVNPLDPTETTDLTAWVMSRIDCITPGAALHAALSDLDRLDLAERLVAASDAGADVHLLLTRPSAEVEALLTSRLGDRARVCGQAGCASTPGGQEANMILISRTLTSEGERDGAVIYASAPLRTPEPAAGPEPLAEVIARHGDVGFYEATLAAWRAISEGRRAARAVGTYDVNLKLSLDLHMADHSPQAILSRLTRCDYRDDAGANVWITSPYLGDAQEWLMPHITRLEGSNCTVKVLVNNISPLLASRLGARARLTSRPLHLAALTGVFLNNQDNIRHEETWSAPASWYTAEGDYEGGAFWMWNEWLMLHYSDPISAMWASGSAP